MEAPPYCTICYNIIIFYRRDLATNSCHKRGRRLRQRIKAGTSCSEEAVRRVLESAERRWGSVLSKSSRSFILGSRGVSAGAGHFCFHSHGTRGDDNRLSSELCPHPVGDTGFATFYCSRRGLIFSVGL